MATPIRWLKPFSAFERMSWHLTCSKDESQGSQGRLFCITRYISLLKFIPATHVKRSLNDDAGAFARFCNTRIAAGLTLPVHKKGIHLNRRWFCSLGMEFLSLIDTNTVFETLLRSRVGECRF